MVWIGGCPITDRPGVCGKGGTESPQLKDTPLLGFFFSGGGVLAIVRYIDTCPSEKHRLTSICHDSWEVDAFYPGQRVITQLLAHLSFTIITG